jgi:hypothetical protein
MRFTFIDVRDGKRRVLWRTLAVFSAIAYAVVFAAAEAFWLAFTGGFSPLIGALALFTATLIVVRMVGEATARPDRHLESWLNRS